MSDRVIVIATRNTGKHAEISRVMCDVPAQWRSLEAFAGIPDAIESGSTFFENARLKAVHYGRHTGQWALADDSGLEVDALNGAPGVHSARYAGENADDATNNAKLIDALRTVPQSERTARFRCVLVLASGSEVIATTEGVIDGVIIDQPRGENGFGYDPYFFVPSLNATLAELSPERKNAVSHRGRALATMTGSLMRLLAQATD